VKSAPSLWGQIKRVSRFFFKAAVLCSYFLQTSGESLLDNTLWQTFGILGMRRGQERCLVVRDMSRALYPGELSLFDEFL